MRQKKITKLERKVNHFAHAKIKIMLIKKKIKLK